MNKLSRKPRKDYANVKIRNNMVYAVLIGTAISTIPINVTLADEVQASMQKEVDETEEIDVLTLAEKQRRTQQLIKAFSEIQIDAQSIISKKCLESEIQKVVNNQWSDVLVKEKQILKESKFENLVIEQPFYEIQQEEILPQRSKQILISSEQVIRSVIQGEIISEAEIYANTLLKEGVITETEAEMIKQNNYGPDNPYINYTEEDVIYLGDAMDAEVCILLLKTNKGKRAFYLTGSALINRIGNRDWGAKQTVKEVIYSEVCGYQQYGMRTRNLVGKQSCVSHGHEFVYDWARDILTYGPICSERLVYQGGKRRGKVYEEIGGEYFGTY